MARAVLIIGESGTGKSASLRNFAKGDVTYFNVAGKPRAYARIRYQTLHA